METNNKINGRTPEEIKKGLVEAMETASWVVEGGDAHDLQDAVEELHASCAYAHAYIQQLESERDQYKRERDAAVERLARYRKCIDCKRYPEVIKNLYCDDCEYGSKWQWCGEPLEVK